MTGPRRAVWGRLTPDQQRRHDRGGPRVPSRAEQQRRARARFAEGLADLSGDGLHLLLDGEAVGWAADRTGDGRAMSRPTPEPVAPPPDEVTRHGRGCTDPSCHGCPPPLSVFPRLR